MKYNSNTKQATRCPVFARIRARTHIFSNTKTICLMVENNMLNLCYILIRIKKHIYVSLNYLCTLHIGMVRRFNLGRYNWLFCG